MAKLIPFQITIILSLKFLKSYRFYIVSIRNVFIEQLIFLGSNSFEIFDKANNVITTTKEDKKES
jgi:hypothetical protein